MTSLAWKVQLKAKTDALDLTKVDQYHANTIPNTMLFPRLQRLQVSSRIVASAQFISSDLPSGLCSSENVGNVGKKHKECG